MDGQTIEAIVEELKPMLVGRIMGRVFQLTRASLAIDFRPHEGRYLFISVEPDEPRLYSIARAAREMEKQSLALSPFALVLRKHLGGATLKTLNKEPTDRIVRFSFAAHMGAGDRRTLELVAQLTGRTANVFLLDESKRIIDALRPSRGAGQEVGDEYGIPPQHASAAHARPSISRGAFNTLSEAADDYYRQREIARAFDTHAAALRARLRQQIEKRRRLERNLLNDLTAHGDAAEHKRIGDLLLANIATAERRGSTVRLMDYYAEGAPVIELEIDENSTLQEEAARHFARYAKAKRAAQETGARLDQLQEELAALEAERLELEKIIAGRDEEALDRFAKESNATRGTLRRGERRLAADAASEEARGAKSRAKASESVPGTRRYRSTDGYEILVGRGAKDNDYLTFRIARPHDAWLHAADYPGSHVVVRNPTRGEIPHRTIIEAAQLAANYSQAKRDAKVAVHYTQRKFVSKLKGAAPGLVRLSSFRTLLVEPREAGERI